MGNPGPNQVELTGHFGSDLTHALSAWTSTSRELNPAKEGRVGDLLKMLAENDHHSVFEKSYLQFLLTVDTASHVHLLKHRIGVSINGESARYKELKDDKYYMPVDWPEEERVAYAAHVERALQEYHVCLIRLVEGGMNRKRAKESARFYLPFGNQIVLDVSFNFRSFAHFLTLRYSMHAQKEIRELAREMLLLVSQTGKFDRTLRAFGLVFEDGTLCEPFK